MKNFSARIPLLGVILSLPFGMSAAEVNATVTAPVAPPAQVSLSATAPSKLPYAATEVLKLTRAQVSEDVIVSYVHNSTPTTSLSSDDIVLLKNAGVTDRVISAMMDKNSKAIERLPSNAAPAPVYAEANVGDEAPTAGPQQPATAPLTPAGSGSSTYVIPYPAVTSAYYGYYSPYYSPYYYGYGGPIFSFGFGYGGGYYHHGGYHGGYHGGGGIHAHGHR